MLPFFQIKTKNPAYSFFRECSETAARRDIPGRVGNRWRRRRRSPGSHSCSYRNCRANRNTSSHLGTVAGWRFDAGRSRSPAARNRDAAARNVTPPPEMSSREATLNTRAADDQGARAIRSALHESYASNGASRHTHNAQRSVTFRDANESERGQQHRTHSGRCRERSRASRAKRRSRSFHRKGFYGTGAYISGDGGTFIRDDAGTLTSGKRDGPIRRAICGIHSNLGMGGEDLIVV